MKDYNSGKIELPEAVSADSEHADTADAISYRDDDLNLTRDCNYYEEYAMPEVAR